MKTQSKDCQKSIGAIKILDQVNLSMSCLKEINDIKFESLHNSSDDN